VLFPYDTEKEFATKGKVTRIAPGTFAVGRPLVSRSLALNRLTRHALIASAVPTPAPLFLCPMDGFQS
jgi:hypothetical protein